MQYVGSIKTVLATAVISLLLGACGGGGGGSSSDNNTVSKTPGSATGIVADGYLLGATVCLDINSNKICDGDEPSTTTGAGGAYTLDVTDKTLLDQYPLLVEVPATAIDEDTGVEVGKKFILSAPAGNSAFISPLTTMVQNKIEADPKLSVADAEAALIISMGKNPAEVSLFVDYVEAKNDDSNPAAADYSTLHNIAQVTARTLANNIETIEAAVADGSVVLDLNEVFDALIQLVVEEVVNQLAAITADVVTAEAASSDGTFDADVVTTASNITVDTTTIEDEVAVVEATESATDTAFEQQLVEGFNWIWGEINADWREIETGTVTVVDGVALETQRRYNFSTGAFEAFTPSADIYLGSNGWISSADDLSVCSVTFNSDGSGTFACSARTFTISASEVDVAGLNVATYIDGTDNGSFTSIIDSAAVFSSGAKAYTLSFTNDAASYELDTDSNILSNNSAPTSLSDLLSPVGWVDDGHSEPKAVWVGFKRSPEGCVEPAYSVNDADTLCTYSQGMLVEFVGSGTSGTAKFYLTDYINRNIDTGFHSVGLVASSSWSIQVVNGVAILTYTTPASVISSYSQLFEDRDQDQRFYAVYNNVVYQGDYTPAGSSDSGEVGFNNTAIADVINSLIVDSASSVADDTGGDNTSTSLACDYESGWNDTTDQPTTFNSYADFEEVVAACGGLQVITTAGVSGTTWVDSWTEADGVVWEETIVFNSDGTFSVSEKADGVAMGTGTGNWSVADNLLTLSGPGFVDIIAITNSGAQKAYIEESTWGSDLTTLDDTAEGEIFSSDFVMQ